MKKLSLFIIAAFFSGMAVAQLQLGAKAGLNLANFSVSPAQPNTSFKLKPDFNAGILVYVPLFKNFGLQPEIMYSGQGSKINISNTDYRYNLNYLNVPVFFKYKDPSGFFAELGPQLGVLLSGKVKVNGQSQDIKSSHKSTDFSAALGVGYLSSINLGFDARYNLGLTNTSSSDPADGSIKNGVIQFSIFYMFRAGKK